MLESLGGKVNSSSKGQYGELKCDTYWVFMSTSQLSPSQKSFQGQMKWQLQKQNIALYYIVLLSDCNFKRLGCTQIYSIYHAQMHVSKVKCGACRHLRLYLKK